MKATVFTDGSSTTNDVGDDVEMGDYFRGNFFSTTALYRDLRERREIDVHIRSGKFGPRSRRRPALGSAGEYGRIGTRVPGCVY